MSRLTDLRAVLDGNDRCLTVECRECDEAECPCDVLHDMLFPADGTTPTIRSLVEVVEAAEREPYCPFCGEQRHMAGWPTQPHLRDCPLFPLVKEADDE